MSRRSTDGPERIVIPFHPARKAQSTTTPGAHDNRTGKDDERRKGQRRDHGSGAKQPPLAPMVEKILKPKGQAAAPPKRSGTKLADFSSDERCAFDRAIDFYRYVGKSDAEATSLAWSDVQLAFPRLLEYAGPITLAPPA